MKKKIISKVVSSDKGVSATINRSKRKTRVPTKLCTMTGSNMVFTINTKTYRQIRKLQSHSKNVIPMAPFVRLIREILIQFGGQGLRIQCAALQALQDSCEIYMTQFFEDSYLATLHACRKTLQVKDMRFVRKLRGIVDIINH